METYVGIDIGRNFHVYSIVSPEAEGEIRCLG
jgi:hypothetical protein